MDFSLYFFSANDQAPFADRYDFIIDAAQYLDRNDFTAIWTPERHFEEFGGSFPNPSVMSAALATATENLDLRAGSVAYPLHHPIRVVEEWALVDQLSKGRTGICMATGWHRGDFVLQPDQYHNRREHTFEGVQLVRDLWAGKEVEFEGVDGQEVSVQTYPRPYSDELPIWLVFSSSPETWIQAGKLGLNILALLNNFERLENHIDRYREARAEHGHDPDAGIVTIGVHTFIGDDEQEVKQLVADPVKQYLSTFLDQRSSDADLEGESKDVSGDEADQLLQLTFDDMFANRSLLGTLPKCIETVERMQSIGVDEVASLIDFGLDFDLVRDHLPNLVKLKNHFDTGGDGAVDPAEAEDDMSWYYDG